MDDTLDSSNATPPTPTLNEVSSTCAPCPATPSTSNIPLAQIDGSADYHAQVMGAITKHDFMQPSLQRSHPQQQRHHHQSHQARNTPSTQAIPCQQSRAPKNAISDLLPYCTTGPPLSDAQVIALSDEVGSLKELVLLALGAASGGIRSVERLEGAVGRQAAASIVDFFVDEWQVVG